MDWLSELPTLALAGVVALLLLLVLRRRQRSQREEPRDNADTVAGWPPEAARVLTIDERHAFDLLRRALPNHLVLAQVPLSRFIRVPLRRSYSEWLQRVGSLSADLMVCDAGSRVIAVIDIRSASESERSRRRHERMSRVLRHAGVHVLTWREGALPGAAEVRNAMLPLLAPAAAPAAKGSSSRPMPLIPVAEMEEILADGDHRHAEFDTVQEPVPSGYYDDELQLTPTR